MKLVKFLQTAQTGQEVPVTLNAHSIMDIRVKEINAQTYIAFDMTTGMAWYTQGESEAVMMRVYNGLIDFLANEYENLFDVEVNIAHVKEILK